MCIPTFRPLFIHSMKWNPLNKPLQLVTDKHQSSLARETNSKNTTNAREYEAISSQYGASMDVMHANTLNPEGS